MIRQKVKPRASVARLVFRVQLRYEVRERRGYQEWKAAKGLLRHCRRSDYITCTINVYTIITL